MKEVALIWFHNDLRVIDQQALAAAMSSGKKVIGLYCFDPLLSKETNWGFPKTGKYRAQFLLETVANLKSNLNQLNIDLLLYHDETKQVIKELVATHHVTTIYYQEEWTYEERSLTNALKENASLKHINWYSYYDQFLFHPEDVPYKNWKDIPQVFTVFRKQLEKHSTVRPLLRTPEPLALENRIDNPTSLPTLEDLGYPSFESDSRSAFPFRGGESSARKRLQDYFWDTQQLAVYKKTRNGLLGTNYSSKLSAWLANGSISPRLIYHEIKRFEREVKKNQDTYWLIFELIWRDYFKYISLKYGDKIFWKGGILNRDYEWTRNKKALDQWINGRTPYDFVNANMIELRKTGWMSNRGRQNVASFWAKEWQQDWRIGAAWFESMLIDYDVHSNYGNWMYNAGVGNDPRDRKFNIQLQAQRYDGDGKYVRTWLQNTLFV